MAKIVDEKVNENFVVLNNLLDLLVDGLNKVGVALINEAKSKLNNVNKKMSLSTISTKSVILALSAKLRKEDKTKIFERVCKNLENFVLHLPKSITNFDEFIITWQNSLRNLKTIVISIINENKNLDLKLKEVFCNKIKGVPPPILV